MDINAVLNLKYAFAAVEHGSMRQVALAFGVDESTVSRNILALEQFIDLQLFERRNDGVRLSGEGKAWLDGIGVHYEALETALSATALRRKDLKKLRLGINLSVGRDFLVKLIRRFQKSYPGVAISIEDIPYRNYAYAIRRRTFDIAFMNGRCRARSCMSSAVWEERLAVLLPAGHPLSGRRAVSWADLAGEELLIPAGKGATQFDPDFMGVLTTSTDRPAIRSCNATQSTIFIDVQLGRGIALADESLARFMTIEHAVWRPIEGPSSVNQVSAIWLESNPKRAVFRLLAMAKHMGCAGGGE
jgi:DNA-binding transcriptional LysR family regulator